VDRIALEQRLLARARQRAAAAPQTRSVVDGPEPATRAQERLFFLHQLEPADRSYRIAVSLRLTGPLDRDAVSAAVAATVGRHAALRTVLCHRDGRLWQDRLPAEECALRHAEATPPAGGWTPEAVADVVAEETDRPFDLTAGPLFRATLIQLDAEDHVLLLVLHHVIADAWSITVLCADLSAAYRDGAATLSPVDGPWPPVPSAESAASLRFWLDELESAPPAVNLPLDFPRRTSRRHRGARLSRSLGPAARAAVDRVATAARATVASVLLAGYATVLHRWTGQPDLVIGLAVSGRTRAEDQHVIGLLANTLPVRIPVDPTRGFTNTVRTVHSRVVRALEHQQVALEEVVAAAGRGGERGRNPLFNVLFAMQNVPPVSPRFAGLHTEVLPVAHHGAKLDLALHVTPEGDGGLHLSLEYDTDLFRPETAAALADQVASFFGPEAPVVPPPGTYGPVRDVGPEPVVARILAQANRRPDAVALRHGTERLTYGELARWVERLASVIRGRVSAGGVIAVRLPNGFDLIATLLATHLARCAYLPLDASWPVDRVRLLLHESGAELLVAAEDQDLGVPLVAPTAAEAPADPPLDPPGPDDLAYVIYTSGSTGVPKGVMVEQRGLTNHILWAVDAFAGGGSLLLSSVGYDLPVPVLFAPLVAGATLTIAQPAEAALTGAAELAVAGGYGFLKLTPSHLRALAAEVGWPALARAAHRIMLAGEELTGRTVRPLAEHAPELALLNEYGPTEVSVACTAFAGTAGDFALRDRVPIGTPLWNMAVHVLDERLRPVLAGCLGEVYVGGTGVARGYLGRPGLTAARFLPDPYSATPGARMYRTGDLARRLAEGQLVFHRRADDQVKIRGVRVEPEEVERALHGHPLVDQARVVVSDVDGDAVLSAFVVAGPWADAAQITAWLRRQLPEQLVPERITLLDALPLTGNGKLDRTRLPAEAQAPKVALPTIETPTERALALIWTELLNAPAVDAAADFFALGGHSLLAVRLVEQVGRSFGVTCPLHTIFDAPTLREFATVVESLVHRHVESLTAEQVIRQLEEVDR